MASRSALEPNGKPEPGSILLVIHDFQARSSDELSLLKGDRVELVERDDDFGDGWYLGKHLMNGNTGLFPEVYTKPAPRGQPSLPETSATIPRSHPISAPPSGVSNPPTVTVPSSVFSTTEIPSSATVKIADLPESDPQTSAAVPEEDRTPQASRHVSASGLSDPSTITSSAITVAPADDVDVTPALSASSTGAVTVSVPRNPALASAVGVNDHGQESPVMTETLGVIQEHISNMGTPRHGGSGDRRGTNDSGSEYSSHIDNRMSYINGEETDEEQSSHGEDEVAGWTADQVADYLASVGVEQKHCDYFREQEITGDVLLAMDQDTILHPQFDIGPVGRRLKTWTKIKTLQNEVQGFSPTSTRRSTQNYANEIGSESPGRLRSQSHTGATVLPRITSFNDRPGSRQNVRNSQQQRTRTSTIKAPIPISPISPSPVSPVSPIILQNRSNTMNDAPRRPSAASIRDLHHSRRHSSNDFNATLMASTSTLATGTESPTALSLGISHKKGPSFDRNWTMGSQSPAFGSRPVSTGKTGLLDEDEGLPGVSITTPWEFDRGYFSGGELEGRQRNVLRKRGSASHSRNSSYADEQRARSGTTNARHSRFGSVDSFREPHLSPASQKYYGVSVRGRRTPSTTSIPKPPLQDVPSPTVTKLDGSTISRSPTDSPRSADKMQSPDWLQAGNGIASPRGLGVRAISDAVTGTEKSRAVLPSESSPLKEDPLQSPSRTGSTTSGGPSLDLDSPSGSKPPSTMMTTPGSKTSRKKSKKETSAYTRGLQKKTPQEQMADCDYSGWMKKKSSSIMATWKPRLFILKGRRLSYYYSETDDQERGLIDISNHRVLPANDDFLTGLHATLTGATTSPTSPLNSQTETMASKDAAAEPQSTLSKATGDQIFIFKLVPPRAGMSRAVTFTKPTVHYFACPNITQGRLWMGALMKATIDRDDSKAVITTYQQKTISLAKARAMRHRPPALMNLDEKVEDETAKTPPTDLSGLNIRGIIFNKEVNGHDSGVSGVSKQQTHLTQKIDDFGEKQDMLQTA